MNKWITLIISLPTENATTRMRAWRSLKASGAAVLRDGVYLTPNLDQYRNMLQTVAADVIAGGGSAYVLRVEEPDDGKFISLFDRSEDYAKLLADTIKLRDELTTDIPHDAMKQSRRLRKAFASLAEIDFFPGEAQRQTNAALQDLELAISRALSPDEPHLVDGTILHLIASEYQNRTWATRCRPWVDRLASAWLIRRYIDPQASILWLASPSDCPATALGFDFDGATFSHINNRVTFEVLLASFSLENPPLKRLGALVHYLDVGGVQPPEATGIESVLAGMRATILNDDQLLETASSVFDGLLAIFDKETTIP